MVLYPGKYRVGVDVDGSVGWEFELVGDEMMLDGWPAKSAVTNGTMAAR